MAKAKRKKNCDPSRSYACGAACIVPSKECHGNKLTNATAKEGAKILDQSRYASVDREARRLAQEMRKQAIAAEPEVTASLKRLAAEYGGEMVMLQHAIKGEESLTRKIRDKTLKAQEDGEQIEPKDVEVTDVLRYTMQLPEESYTKGIRAAVADLKLRHGFVELENNWPRGDAYNGVNSLFKTPDGLIYELQFHTKASLEAKEKTHPDYEIYRSKTESYQRKLDAFNRMVEIADSAPMPPDILDLGIGVLRFRPFQAAEANANTRRV